MGPSPTLTTTVNGPEDEEEARSARVDLSRRGVIDDTVGLLAQQNCNCHFLVLLASVQTTAWGHLGNLHTCGRCKLGLNTWVSAALMAMCFRPVLGRGPAAPQHEGIYHPESYSICLELQIRRKGVDGRSLDSVSLAIIHRQANQASKSGTMALSKNRVGIKAVLTGHCNSIEMFTLHLSKGNGCGA